ncbi:MAG: hypothetical protein AAGF97_18650 [Planctomycetota bacterium]
MSIQRVAAAVAAILCCATPPLSAQDVHNLAMSYRATPDTPEAGDVEFCVVHLRASDEWRAQHECHATVGDTRMDLPAVFRSPPDQLGKHDLSTSHTTVRINDVPIEISVEPAETLEVVLVSFEYFEHAVEGEQRALVTRFTLQPISEIKDYEPPAPNKMRLKLSSWFKFEASEPFPGLTEMLARAAPMPRANAVRASGPQAGE